MLVTGIANIELWYPWPFFFPAGHYAVAWVTIGALVVHIGAKASITGGPSAASSRPRTRRLAAGRRRFLGLVVGSSAVLVVVTVGQTCRRCDGSPCWLHGGRDVGVQGFPVNKHRHRGRRRDVGDVVGLPAPGRARRRRCAGVHARRARRHAAAHGDAADRLRRGLERQRRVDGRAAARPCSTRPASAARRRSRSSRSSAGAATGHRSSNGTVLADADTLLAMQVDGEPLTLDHGFPLRLIAPNRPGVLQTKWVGPAGGVVSDEPVADRPSARWFVPALVVGWALIGVGVWSALQTSRRRPPARCSSSSSASTSATTSSSLRC